MNTSNYHEQTTPDRYACTECGHTFKRWAEVERHICFRKQICGIVDREQNPELYAEVTGTP